jgi:two-component sensor histidine kinase
MLLEQQAALLTEGLPQRMQLEWADLLILEPDGRLSSLRADAAGRPPPRPQLPSFHPLLALLRAGQPLLRLQLPPHAPAEVQELLDAHQIEVSIPLIVGTRLIGVYNLGPKRSGDPVDLDELRLLHVLSQQAAAAIENGRLFRAERTERELAQALAEAAAVVNSTLELDLVLERILEQVERVVAGDAFNIMLVEGDHLRVVRWRGYDRFGAEEVIRGLFLPIAALPPVARMLERGEPVLVEETETDPLWVSLERRGWIRSFVGAPIWLDGRCVGALNVDGTRPRQFTWADAARLQAFGHHAAIALKSARLFEQVQHELAERRQAEQQLRHLLREKDILLREIHHRIKNNLQVVSSMLSLQADRVSDEAALRAFQDSQDRIRSMALIHERLYQTENLTRIAFGDYTRGLIRYLQRVYDAGARGIALDVRAEEIHLTIDVAVPCGLILNELLSNALKHAFPDGRSGTIVVEIASAQSEAQGVRRVTLRVSDDGIGMPPQLDIQRSGTLGLQLVHTLVGQLGGTLRLERQRGTRFEITFPVPGE